jgi:glycosyltransferase involved in cell wall biosynthesis
MTAVTVSAIIPAHNAEPFLREAIESVLKQSLAAELIVVNDGSTDATEAIIESYGSLVKGIAQEQCGLGAARNRGVQVSQGAWIAFLDADDLWTPDKLRLQMRAVEARPDVDMVFGHCVEFTDPVGDVSLVARTRPFAAVSACAMLARRALFDSAGAFSEHRRVGEFIDWYSRARNQGAASLMLDDVVFRRRVHGSNMTRVMGGTHEQYLDVVRAHLRRRRAGE